MKSDDQEKDWVKVLYEVILKILTLGFYHVESRVRQRDHEINTTPLN